MDVEEYGDMLRDITIDHCSTPSQLEEMLEYYVEFPEAKIGFVFTTLRRIATLTLDSDGYKCAVERIERLIMKFPKARANQLIVDWLKMATPDREKGPLRLDEERYNNAVEREIDRYRNTSSKIIQNTVS